MDPPHSRALYGPLQVQGLGFWDSSPCNTHEKNPFSFPFLQSQLTRGKKLLLAALKASSRWEASGPRPEHPGEWILGEGGVVVIML